MIIMRLRLGSLVSALTLLVPSAAHAQAPTIEPGRNPPDFRVQTWGDLATHFSSLVLSFVELRRELEQGLPPLVVTADPAEINRAERALARRIRVARADAKQGDIFTPAISDEFRKVLRRELNDNRWAAVMDDNPGEFKTRMNGTYPKRKPLSTVPPSILAVLPWLPDDIEYRFLGRHLILFDTRARVILDRIPYAISCSGGACCTGSSPAAGTAGKPDARR